MREQRWALSLDMLVEPDAGAGRAYILTNDEISLLRSLEKKSRTITGNFTHKRYDRLETKGYIKRSSQPPSMQGCWWRLRMK